MPDRTTQRILAEAAFVILLIFAGIGLQNGMNRAETSAPSSSTEPYTYETSSSLQARTLPADAETAFESAKSSLQNGITLRPLALIGKKGTEYLILCMEQESNTMSFKMCVVNNGTITMTDFPYTKYYDNDQSVSEESLQSLSFEINTDYTSSNVISDEIRNACSLYAKDAETITPVLPLGGRFANSGQYKTNEWAVLSLVQKENNTFWAVVTVRKGISHSAAVSSVYMLNPKDYGIS